MIMDKCSNFGICFDKAWVLCPSQFCKPRQFVGGLTSMVPNKTTAEADFSLMGYEKNEYRQSLIDFSLDFILLAKQFDALPALLVEQCSQLC